MAQRRFNSDPKDKNWVSPVMRREMGSDRGWDKCTTEAWSANKESIDGCKLHKGHWKSSMIGVDNAASDLVPWSRAISHSLVHRMSLFKARRLFCWATLDQIYSESVARRILDLRDIESPPRIHSVMLVSYTSSRNLHNKGIRSLVFQRVEDFSTNARLVTIETCSRMSKILVGYRIFISALLVYFCYMLPCTFVYSTNIAVSAFVTAAIQVLLWLRKGRIAVYTYVRGHQDHCVVS